MTTKDKLSFLVSRGMTISEFARRVNCNKNTLSQWLRGVSNISSRLEKDINREINLFLQELENIKEN